jgi:hypothetical protein
MAVSAVGRLFVEVKFVVVAVGTVIIAGFVVVVVVVSGRRQGAEPLESAGDHRAEATETRESSGQARFLAHSGVGVEDSVGEPEDTEDPTASPVREGPHLFGAAVKGGDDVGGHGCCKAAALRVEVVPLFELVVAPLDGLVAPASQRS